MKTSGALFKQFYADPTYWPDDDGDTYHDDVLLAINGKEVPDGVDPSSIKDTDEVTFVSGGVVEGRGNGVGLDEYFTQWLAEQTSVTFTVTCPKDKAEQVRAALEALGVSFA